jgi:molybdenum cofactor cytidylyltransferase
VTVTAILLAAGESSRMGTPKPLLDWGGQTLIEYQIAQLKHPPVDDVVVVLGHRAEAIRPLAERAGARVIINEVYQRKGRASSLRAGASAIPDDVRAVLVLHVDQPRPHSIIERLLQTHNENKNLISVPSHEGKRGHPTVLDGWLLPDLRTVRERTQGMRALIERYEESVAEVPFESDIVLLDINSPTEYKKAKERYFEQVTR